MAPFELTANAVGGELNGSKAQLKLTQGEGGAITVSAADGADYAVEADGDCSFNRAKLLQNRRIYLKYQVCKRGADLSRHRYADVPATACATA